MSSEHQSSGLAEDSVEFPTALAISIGPILAASVVLTVARRAGVPCEAGSRD